MQLGLVGLGTMGGPMARRLVDAGHHVVGADVSPAAVERAREARVDVTDSLSELVARLAPPRAVWVMVPPTVAGSVLDGLADLLTENDVVIDGGNSDWRLACERAARLAESGVRFLDVGVSGGQWRSPHPVPWPPSGRRAPGTSSKPCTTPSSTASCRPTRKASRCCPPATGLTL
jgi:6-phosphogluconate dehydrogenase